MLTYCRSCGSILHHNMKSYKLKINKIYTEELICIEYQVRLYINPCRKCLLSAAAIVEDNYKTNGEKYEKLSPIYYNW